MLRVVSFDGGGRSGQSPSGWFRQFDDIRRALLTLVASALSIRPYSSRPARDGRDHTQRSPSSGFLLSERQKYIFYYEMCTLGIIFMILRRAVHAIRRDCHRMVN